MTDTFLAIPDPAFSPLAPSPTFDKPSAAEHAVPGLLPLANPHRTTLAHL